MEAWSYEKQALFTPAGSKSCFLSFDKQNVACFLSTQWPTRFPHPVETSTHCWLTWECQTHFIQGAKVRLHGVCWGREVTSLSRKYHRARNKHFVFTLKNVNCNWQMRKCAHFVPIFRIWKCPIIKLRESSSYNRVQINCFWGAIFSLWAVFGLYSGPLQRVFLSPKRHRMSSKAAPSGFRIAQSGGKTPLPRGLR